MESTKCGKSIEGLSLEAANVFLKRRWLRTDTKEVPVKADGASKVPPIPKNGTLRFPVPNPVFVTEGTWPKGSMWARDPVSSPEARHPISRL